MKLLRLSAALAVASLAACATHIPPVDPPQRPRVSFDVAACEDDAVRHADGTLSCKQIPDVTFRVDKVPGEFFSPDGYLYVDAEADTLGETTEIVADAVPYHHFDSGLVKVADLKKATHNFFVMEPVPPPHVDPSKKPLLALSHIRGSMWTARYPMPWGPRPNDPTNILNLSAVFNYATEAEQIAAFKDYTDSGYTHDVLGPWVPNNDCGYHGEWPCRQDTFDQWLDQHQFYWDRGVTPVVFIKPDNWTLAQL